eukprot:gene9067-10006_t
MAEDWEDYLNQAEDRVKQLVQQVKSTDSVSVITQCAQKQYELGQLLCSMGRSSQALSYMRNAQNILLDYRTDPVYSTLYYSLCCQLAIVLDGLGKLEDCELLFEELNQLQPDGWHLGDCAFFLHRRKRDYDHAELFYKRALSLYPQQSSIHLKYAGFLRHVRKDLVGAEDQYKQAILTNPSNAEAVGSYASFLHGVLRRTSEAEALYQQACQLDDTHANNLCNYGLFLSEERQDYEGAEKKYRRVLEIHPHHANTLYNYAVLLDSHLGRKGEAAALYRTAIKQEAKHAYALYNLAVLLEEQYFSASPGTIGTASTPEVTAEQKAEIAELFRRAAEADPRDANSQADYGRYLYVRMNEIGNAEAKLQAALVLDPQCEGALYHLALLTYRERKQLDSAYQLLQRLLSMQPNHSNGILLRARLLSDRVRLPGASGSEKESALEDAIKTYEQAMTLHQGSDLIVVIVSEYLRFVQSYGSSRMKLAAIRVAGEYLPRDKLKDCQELIDQLKVSVNEGTV